MEKEVKKQFGGIGESYDDQIPHHVRDYLFEKWWGLVHVYFNHDCKVLDVGCGDGTIVNVLRGKKIETFGVDGSHELLRAGLKRNPQLSQCLALGDALHLSFPSSSFDAVSLVGVLHHIHSRADQLKVITECLRVLKVGGYLLIRECNIRNPLFRFFWNYVFPLLAKIDRFGGENWIPVDYYKKKNLNVYDLKFFTFLPNFTPLWLMPIATPFETWLERSPLASLSAHYTIVIKKC